MHLHNSENIFQILVFCQLSWLTGWQSYCGHSSLHFCGSLHEHLKKNLVLRSLEAKFWNVTIWYQTTLDFFIDIHYSVQFQIIYLLKKSAFLSLRIQSKPYSSFCSYRLQFFALWRSVWVFLAQVPRSSHQFHLEHSKTPSMIPVLPKTDDECLIRSSKRRKL